MIRVYYTEAFLEEIEAALNALPPLLRIRRKGIDTRVLSDEILEMKRAGRRIPEIAADLRARGIPVHVDKPRAYLRKRGAHERTLRHQAAGKNRERTVHGDRAAAFARLQAGKVWS